MRFVRKLTKLVQEVVHEDSSQANAMTSHIQRNLSGATSRIMVTVS